MTLANKHPVFGVTAMYRSSARVDDLRMPDYCALVGGVAMSSTSGESCSHVPLLGHPQVRSDPVVHSDVPAAPQAHISVRE